MPAHSRLAAILFRAFGSRGGQRRRDRKKPRAFAVEILEPRQLLAVVVDSTNLQNFRDAAGNYLFSDASSVTFQAGTRLDAGSGSINIASPQVTIGENTQLTTSGSVVISASKSFPTAGGVSNLWNQAFTIVEAIAGMQTRVDVHRGAAITAGTVSIDAFAGDDSSIVDLLSFNGSGSYSIPLLGQAVFYKLGELIKDDVYALPLSAQIKQPRAAITIDPGAAITTTSGDVSISAAATADATGQAIYSVLANRWAANLRGGAAAGFSYVDAESIVTVAGSIRSQGAAKVVSTTNGVAQMTSRVTLNQGLQRTNPENVEVAYAGTYLESTSRITVAAGASVQAERNVTLTSSVDNTNKVKANTASYRDGLVGVTIGTGWSYGTSEVIVDGAIRAGKVDVPRGLTFNPAFAFDMATGRLRFPEPIDFSTGDEIRYSAGVGQAIPGLVDGAIYFAIVDPQDPNGLRLASSAADALAGRSVELGSYPTLTAGDGRTLPITVVEAAISDTLRFDEAVWPDGSPLFTSGQRVRYEPAAGQFLGFNAADGTYAGAIPAGDYVVRVVPLEVDESGLAIQLLEVGEPLVGGRAIDLNDNPLFRLADGSVLQIFSLDADSGQISLNFPRQGTGEGEVPFPTPGQTVNLSNGQPITYVAAFGSHVPGLEDGRTYHAIVDPDEPGVIRLAATAAQALAADPSVQRAVPKLMLPGGRILDIGNVEPETGLVFASDPGLVPGSPVVYHAVPGKRVGGLVDGTTYYAYPLPNPLFEPDWPQYVVGLRTAADTTLPLIAFSLEQSLDGDDGRYRISGVDATSGSIALALPTAAEPPRLEGGNLVGGRGSVTPIPAGSLQVWTTAIGGTFSISLPGNGSETTTSAIAFDAPAPAVMSAINSLGFPGVSVTAAFGHGTPTSPWTLVGSGLNDIGLDSTALAVGAAWSRATAEGLAAVSSTAVGGSFTLSFPTANGAVLTTDPIPSAAPAAVVRAAVSALPRLLASPVSGTGTEADPWLVSTRLQPIRTGDRLIFRDAWGSTSYGLVDGQAVYAVVQPDAVQGKAGSVILSLAATAADALAATPATLPLDTTVEFATPRTAAMSGVAQTLASTLDSSGISISAKLKSSDQQAVKAANGSEPKLKDFLTRTDIDDRKSDNSSKILGYFKPGVGGDSEFGQLIAAQANGSVNDWFTLSGSGTVLTVVNTARVLIGSTATLATDGQVSLASQITEKVKSNVEATVAKPNRGKLAVALAIDVVDVSNTAKTIVGANASVTGGEGLRVDSKVVYPWAFESSWLGEKWSENLQFETLDTVAKLLGGKFGVDEWFVNHWANAGVKQKNFKDDQLKLTLTASLGWVRFANESTAWIEEGARIHHDTAGIAMPPANPVTVTASTDIAQTALAGLVSLDLSPDNLVKRSRKGDKFTNSLIVASQGENAIGGSVGYFGVDNTTRAYVGGLETETVNGVARPIRTPVAPLRVSTGTGPLNVAASNSLLIVQLGQAGGDASGLGISGTAAVIDVKTQQADAAILGGGDPSRAAVIDAGQVQVNSADTSYVIPIAGAVLVSKNQGVGVSTAIALVDRDVAARVGGRDEETTHIGWIGRLSTAGDVAITATAGGAVTPAAIAAAVGSSVRPAGENRDNPAEQPEGAGAEVSGKFGIAVSGDYAGNQVTDSVQATVNTHGTLASAPGSRSLTLAATNDTLLQTTAGAAAFLSGDGSSLGLAGSAAVTTAASTVAVLLRQATVQEFALDLRATNARRIGGLAASGSGATAGNSGATSVQVVGSVVINTITATTTARIDSATGTGLGEVSLDAQADEAIWAAAGSFLFNVSPRAPLGQGQMPGKSLGIGAAVAVQHVTSTTEATLRDATMEATRAAVAATDKSQLFTFSSGIVAAGAGSSLSGMWANVTVTPTVTAAIDGGTLDVGGAANAAGGIDVATTSALQVVTAAGDLVIGRANEGALVSAGAAVAWVTGNLTTEAGVRRSARVRARRGNVSVSSRTRQGEADASIDELLGDFATPHRESNAIWTFALGVVGATSNLSLAGSWSENRLTSSRSATVTGAATITVDRGCVSLQASDEAGVYSGAGNITVATGGSAKAAIGAAVTRNTIASTTQARIEGATVTARDAGATVSVNAIAGGLIGAAAAGGEWAGKAGVGTSLGFNEIVQTVEAVIGGTADPSGNVTRGKVTAAGGLTVSATDRSRIGVGAGQVSVATAGVAGGAAAASNAIASNTTAVIERADVIANGTVAVKADAAAEIFSYAVGVAGAWSENRLNFGGAGSGTGNTLVRRVLAAVRSQAALDVGTLAVKANDESTINTAAGTLAIQRAGKGGISAAMGVSAATNQIGSQTDAAKASFVKAIIEDATAIVHGNLDLWATATSSIQAITAAGAGEFSSGTNSVVNVAGAGAGSGNTIQLDVEAAVRNAGSAGPKTVIMLPTGGDVSLTARNDPSILAVAGGVEVAGAGKDNQGLAITLGAAATVNDVAITTSTLIDAGAEVLTTGQVALEARGQAAIKAVSFGVAAALRRGAGAFDLTGAGSAAVNTVSSDTLAAVRGGVSGAAGQATSQVFLSAVDRPAISAGAGGLSSVFDFGGGTSVAPSVGVSYTINDVVGSARAVVDGGTVRSNGDVAIAATFDRGHANGTDGNTIFAVSVAGSVDAKFGGDLSLLFPLAGAGNRNTVAFTTEAVVSGGGLVQAGGLSLEAEDRSRVYSNAGGVGIGLAFGSQAGGVAIGAGYGKTETVNTVRAAIDSAEVTARGDLSLTAEARTEIESVAYGVALSLAVGGDAVSAGGSGAASYTTLDNTVAAEILSSRANSQSGSVSLSAADVPAVTSRAGAGTLGVAIGDGVSLAPGVVILETQIRDRAWTRIGTAALGAAPVVTAARAVTLATESQATVSSLGVAVAAAATVGKFGGAFAGAGGRSTVTLQNLLTAEIVAGTVQADHISVTAKDHDLLTRNTFGAGGLAGAVVGGSIGVSLTETTVNNEVSASIGAASLTAAGGGITIDARGGNTLATETVATAAAVAIGGAGAGGHAFATDSSTFQARVTTGAKLASSGPLTVRARGARDDATAPDGSIGAQAHGGSLGIAAVGVVIAKAQDRTRRLATIGDAVDLSGVGGLLLAAASSPNVQAASVAVDVGGVAVTVNQSEAEAAGVAKAATGSGVTLPGADVLILATGTTRLDVSQTGVVDGVAAAGATQSTGRSALATEASLGAGVIMPEGRTGSLVVRATSHDAAVNVRAVAGSGGFFSGFGTTGDLTDATTTRAVIQGGVIRAGAVDVAADRVGSYGLNVDSTSITVGLGVGITRATYSAARTSDDGLERVRVSLAPQTVITATGPVGITASHRVERVGSRPTVEGAGGSLLVSGQQAVSNVQARVPAMIEIGGGTSIDSGSDPLTQPGGIRLQPAAALEVDDAVHLANLGLLVSGGRVGSYLDATLSPQVILGDDVRLTSHGRLDVGTTAFVSTGTRANGWGAALFGGIGTYAESNVIVDQAVRVGARARFASDGSLSVTPGDDPTGASSTALALDATARATTYGLVAVPTGQARSSLTHRSALSFGSDADVSSGGNLFLAARALDPTVTATGEAEINLGGILKTEVDQLATPTSSSQVTLAGSFLAGRESQIEITIPDDRAGSFTGTVRAIPETVFGIPIASAWKYVPDFNPRDYIDQAGFSPDVAATLRSGVAAGPVGAITFAPRGDFSPLPLIVSGGSVTVTGDVIDTSQAALTAHTARISIKNESPDYLVLGRMTIANVEGGAVHFRDGNGKPLSDPQAVGITRDLGAPMIMVEQTYGGGVGGSEYGPAIFLAQPVENLGGGVRIHNAKGSFGQTSTLAAKRIEIDTPNGVFAVDTPTSDWAAAGIPSALWGDSIFWPGGKPGRDQLNGDQAVMHALNAISSGYAIGWRDAASEDELNRLAYGHPRQEDPGTFVFFGGSLPHYENAANTRAHNEGLAATARPDGRRAAWQVTEKYPGKNSGWDHAWMPRLQKLPAEFTSNDPPVAGTGTAVRGQLIVINARTANINGTLEAGGDRAGNQSVVVPASLEATLLDYQRLYRLGQVTAPIYRIPEDRLKKEAASDRLIGASFDARTGRILLDQATSSGGGSVSITGRIINTGGPVAGKIKVQGGSGDLVVRNDTKLPLVTANLQTGGGGKRGVVSITDLNVEDVTRQQTAYVYNGTEILVYRGTRGADLPSLGDLADRLSGTQLTFHPRPDARWQWQLGATLRRDVELRSNPAAVSASGWRFDDADVTAARPWGPWGVAASGEVIFEPNANGFVQRLEASSDATYGGGPWLQVNYGSFGWDTGFSDWHKFWYPSSVRLDMTMSVKADWPIGIDFSGTAFGEILVTSVGDIALAGGTVAPAVSLNSTHGQIAAQSGAGVVEASVLQVRAAGDVGNRATPLQLRAETVSGASASAGIWLDGRSGSVDRPLVVDGLTAPLGSVQIVAAGDLLTGLAGVTAASVSIESVAGGIGSLATPLVVAAGAGGALRLDALALGDVHVRQSQGDLLVSSVRSSSGSVILAAQGNVFNADTWTVDPAAAEARIRQLEMLGATDPEAYREDVVAFEQSVTNRYTLYWSTRDESGNLDLWRVRTAASLNIADPVPGRPNDDQIRHYVASLRGELEAFFAETFDEDWASLPEFQGFRGDYAYRATPAQTDRFRVNRTVTSAQLAIQLATRALDTPPPGESVAGRVNVAGRDVTLISATGSVGKNDGPVTIAAADLASGNLTPRQRQELALAAAPGDARLVRNGDAVTALALNVRRPLVLDVAGRLDVEAPGGIAVAQQTGDLRIGHIGSRSGLVSVIADGSILNSPDRTIDLWGPPVDFSRPDDWSLLGSGGQTLAPRAGLLVPGLPGTATGTWLKTALPTESFRASFTYQALAASNPSRAGLAFVLAGKLPSGTGRSDGYGYDGLTGPKVGFILDPSTYQRNPWSPAESQTLFDQSGTWPQAGQFSSLPPSFWNRPVDVTLVYDAAARRMTITLADSPEATAEQRWTTTYDDIDLKARFGPTAFIGFTSGNDRDAVSHEVTNFSFATGATMPGQRVEIPTGGLAPWVVQASPAEAGFVFSSPAEGPTVTFPDRPNVAAAAWYPTPVRISSDFSVTFRYRHTRGADGMALVFQNASPSTTALGDLGGSLGYGGIEGPKVGYLINIYGSPGTRFDTTGSTGNYQPVALLEPNVWVTVTLTYDAQAKTLTERLSTASGGTHSKTYSDIDLPQLLGGPTATLGFTAASGGIVATQEIQSLAFTSAPVPLSIEADNTRGGWQLNGGLQRLANGELVIPDRPQLATSTWYQRPVTTSSFEASFTYEARGVRPADGLVFVLQRSAAGLTALGDAGGGLGYHGLPGPKVGLLFNIYGTPGVRWDDGAETGAYESVPWLVGGPVTVRIVHDDSAGTLTATLTRPGYTPWTRTWTVDLRGLLGSQAFMGFTSGTGALAATQVVRGFQFRDRHGIASDRAAAGNSPTVRLWSSYGNIGASGDEIAIRGTLEARAPQGSIHTNPPPPATISRRTLVPPSTDAAIDLAAMSDAELRDTVAIDLRGWGNNRLTLDSSQISRMFVGGSAIIYADAGDAIVFDPVWRFDGISLADGRVQRMFSKSGATVSVVGPFDYSNPSNRFDVDGSGAVTPLDALLILSTMRSRQIADLDGTWVELTPALLPFYRFVDVNQDDRLTPLDALLVLNEIARLNRQAKPPEVESEAVPLRPVTAQDATKVTADIRSGLAIAAPAPRLPKVGRIAVAGTAAGTVETLVVGAAEGSVEKDPANDSATEHLALLDQAFADPLLWER